MTNLIYKDKGTLVHKLNPFCKLAWFAAVVILALIFFHPLHLMMLFLCTLAVILGARVWREWTSLLAFFVVFSLALVFINAIVANEGDHVLWDTSIKLPALGVMVITLEGIVYTLLMSLRLLVIISAFAIITFALHPDDLLMSLLRFRLPYKSVLVTTMATRFTPALLKDVATITDVQRSRGLELDKGNLMQRVRHYVAVIVPLLSNSLDRTVQVAEAMESRAFGSGSGRTFYKRITLSRIDYLTLAITLATLGFGIFLRCVGQGTYDPYQSLSDLSLTVFDWSMLLILTILLLMLLPLSRLKARIDLD